MWSWGGTHDRETYVGGVYSKLNGEEQTVPRAEATAALLLLLHMACNTVVELFSDNEIFVEAYNRGEIHCQGILNADIHDQIFTILKTKQITMHAFGMPSHLLDMPDKQRTKPVPAFVETCHKLGNFHADRLAGNAASYYALHSDISNPIIKNIVLARNIQKRAYTIVCSLPHHDVHRSPKKGRPTPLSIPELIANSVHEINAIVDDCVCCDVCFGTCITLDRTRLVSSLGSHAVLTASPKGPGFMVLLRSMESTRTLRTRFIIVLWAFIIV